jgi:hypothetical protein
MKIIILILLIILDYYIYFVVIKNIDNKRWTYLYFLLYIIISMFIAALLFAENHKNIMFCFAPSMLYYGLMFSHNFWNRFIKRDFIMNNQDIGPSYVPKPLIVFFFIFTILLRVAQCFNLLPS